MLKSLPTTILSAILGLWLADYLISGIEFLGGWKTLVLAGLILGLINFFVKPVLKFITLPLRLLTLGLAGLIINMGIIWAIDILFPDLIIEGLESLFYATLILWTVSTVLPIFIPKGKHSPSPS